MKNTLRNVRFSSSFRIFLWLGFVMGVISLGSLCGNQLGLFADLTSAQEPKKIVSAQTHASLQAMMKAIRFEHADAEPSRQSVDEKQTFRLPDVEPAESGYIVRADGAGIVCGGATTEAERALLRAPNQQFLSPLALDQLKQQTNGLRIILNPTEQLRAEPQALAAFQRAAARWEALIRNPITIVVNVDFGPKIFGQPFPAGAIGGALEQPVGGAQYYSALRRALIEGASSEQETALYNLLPDSTIPTDLGNTAQAFTASAVLRALGLLPATADPANELPQLGAPPSIGFNSAFAFDFDASDGIEPGKQDFEGVVLHELGHVLGFTSFVGGTELGSSASVIVTSLDLFRFRPDVTLNSFSRAQRILSSGGLQSFFDGGALVPFSTGRPDGSGGDGEQASHWKDDALNGGQYIGIMDPRVGTAPMRITAADLRAFDAMGYRVSGQQGGDPCRTARPISLGQTINDALASTDCKLNSGRYTDFHSFTGTAGQRIAIELRSANFDTLLFLFFGDNVVAEDDDGGGGRNSRIPPESGFITLASSGTYIIAVTSFEAEARGNYSLSLIGSGAGNGPVISINPASLDFGSVGVGASANRTLTVRNTGDATLNITGINSNNSQFSVTSATSFSVAANGEQTITVRFSPTTNGPQAGTLNIAGNAGANSTVVQLRGEGSGQSEVLLTDDGTSEGGFATNGAIYVNRLTPTRYPTKLQTIRIFLWRFRDLPDPSGARIRLIAFIGAAGATQPPNNPARLLDQEVTIPTVPAAGDFFDFQISNGPVIQSGDLYVGFQNPSPAAGVGPHYDSNGAQQQRGFFSTDNGATYRGPIQVQGGSAVNLMIRAVVIATTTSGNAVSSVSAASFSDAALAPESIVAAFGSNLATSTQRATTLPLPTVLAGTSVKVKDIAGVERLAPLFFVAPMQINYLMPSGTAPGTATVTVTSGNTVVASGQAVINHAVPGLFSANASGRDVVAGTVLRVKADGTQSYEAVAHFDSAQNRLVPAPINLGAEREQVFLLLFGTGWRNRSALSAVTAQVGGAPTPTLYAGAAPDFVGLDQLNLGPLPRALAGRGEVEIRLTVDGQAANPVTVSVR